MEENTWLSYYKVILEKVSFDNFLLKKEYNKAKKTLLPLQLEILEEWMINKGYILI
ncbi:hypothetical protein [Chondrinema litorale]|uniref:hypothetical protein n=1 Tax=Chondrinema litorale TaxID=2994555 RepID=UPI00254371AB|nr:hypothetical protein [Chondrinema litorale]UZR96723.1 hypothetical protein OQ292_21505 [Chondrinema litorale]